MSERELDAATRDELTRTLERICGLLDEGADPAYVLADEHEVIATLTPHRVLALLRDSARVDRLRANSLAADPNCERCGHRASEHSGFHSFCRLSEVGVYRLALCNDTRAALASRQQEP